VTWSTDGGDDLALMAQRQSNAGIVGELGINADASSARAARRARPSSLRGVAVEGSLG
jgi:hypothetical protein